MKLYGKSDLTYNGNIVYNKSNVNKLLNDLTVDGLNGPETLDKVIKAHALMMEELDHSIHRFNELSNLLEERLETLEDIESNRILFQD